MQQIMEQIRDSFSGFSKSQLQQIHFWAKGLEKEVAEVMLIKM